MAMWGGSQRGSWVRNLAVVLDVIATTYAARRSHQHLVVTVSGSGTPLAKSIEDSSRIPWDTLPTVSLFEGSESIFRWSDDFCRP